MKKIFLICLAILLGVQGAAFAKKNDGLPEEQRIKVAVEVTSSSRYKELPTAQLLEDFLISKLTEKNFVNVVGANQLDEAFTAERTLPVQNIGELLVFEAVEMPLNVAVPEDFDADAYRELGAAYVIRCEVLGLGVTKIENKIIGATTSVIGSGISWIGSGSSSRDKLMRRIGTGVNVLGLLEMLDITKCTALNTVVNMQFISVETGEVVWQGNFTGQALKHHKPNKNFDDPWTQAYSESIADTAKIIAKRVNKYVDKVIVQGKSDKSFLPKNLPLGGFKGGKLF